MITVFAILNVTIAAEILMPQTVTKWTVAITVIMYAHRKIIRRIMQDIIHRAAQTIMYTTVQHALLRMFVIKVEVDLKVQFVNLKQQDQVILMFTVQVVNRVLQLAKDTLQTKVQLELRR